MEEKIAFNRYIWAVPNTILLNIHQLVTILFGRQRTPIDVMGHPRPYTPISIDIPRASTDLEKTDWIGTLSKSSNWM